MDIKIMQGNTIISDKFCERFCFLKLLQPFENDDLFDAEIGEDSDDRENGNLSDDDDDNDAPKSPSLGQSHSGEEAATMSSDDESTRKNVKKRKKREAKRKVKS